MKKFTRRISSRSEQVKESISKLEERVIEMINSEDLKERRMKKK